MNIIVAVNKKHRLLLMVCRRGSFNNYVTLEGEGVMPGVTLCDGGKEGCQSVTYAYKKIHIHILGTANSYKILLTQLLLVVTNLKQPFSRCKCQRSHQRHM